MEQSISELSKIVGLPQKDTKKIVEYLKHDILLSLYRMNPKEPEGKEEFNIEMNNKVAKTYQKLYGTKFDPKILKTCKPIPMYLFGIPGQGKSASYFAAAEEICEEMGLNFVTHVEDTYIPKQNDYVMIIEECAGQNSSLTFMGLPYSDEVTIDGVKEKVLKKSINYRFSVLKHVAGGMVLFDDAASAHEVIETVLLPIAQKGTFNGLKLYNSLVGFTGNLGSLDGTNTNKQSTALLTRVLSFFVVDTIDNFCERAYKKYNDDLGDLGYTGFLKRFPNSFAKMPNMGSKSGFPCSRVHDDVIAANRSLVQRYGGRGVGEEKALSDMLSIATSKLGIEEGSKLVAYIDGYVRGADPIAKKCIMQNEFDEDVFKSKYGGGSNPDDMSFAYQFASACGDYAVILINQDHNNFVKATERFGNAILKLSSTEFSFALDHYKNKMANVITEFSTPQQNGRELKENILEKIAMVIHNLDGCSDNHTQILINTISDMNKLEDGSLSVANKKTRTIK